MASVAHEPGHEGITLECPVSCLALRTVADLVAMLANAGRLTGLSETWGRHPHKHPGLDCPLTCLGLSVRVRNVLMYYGDCNGLRPRVRTAGDLLRLLERDELHLVLRIGPKSEGEIRRALIAAGFSAERYPALTAPEVHGLMAERRDDS